MPDEEGTLDRSGLRPVLAGLAIVLTVAALGVAGCDSGDGSSNAAVPAKSGPERAVAATVRRLQGAFAERDYAGLCELLSNDAKEQAGNTAHGSPTKCRDDVARVFSMIRKGGGLRHVAEGRVVSVEVAGDRATATLARDLGRRVEVPLLRAGGSWRLDSFFGTPPAQAEDFLAEVTEAGFPPAHGAGVEVRDSAGRPCPGLDDRRLPRIAGGCRIKLATDGTVPLTIATAFGEFEFSKCTIEQAVRVDASGRTWTDALIFGREIGGGINACGDAYRCTRNPDSEEVPGKEDLLPLRGRLRSAGDGTFVHEVDVCLETCIGYYAGKLVTQLSRDGQGWRAEASGGVGDSGFAFDASLDVTPGSTRFVSR
jgi:hypothetical protein